MLMLHQPSRWLEPGMMYGLEIIEVQSTARDILLLVPRIKLTGNSPGLN